MEATIAFPLLVGLVAVALFFDFLNGLHDAANSIATIVSTRVLRPHYAVFWACMSLRRWERASSTPASSRRR